MKRKIKTICCIVVCVITLILNIVLLSTNVFKGTYQTTISGNSHKITLYDNTYDYTVLKNGKYVFKEEGFYTYLELRKVPNENTNIKNDVLGLIPNNKSDATLQFDRKNVFCVSLRVSSMAYVFNIKDGTNFYCEEAIALQVIYAISILIASLVLIFEYYKPKKKNDREREGHQQMGKGSHF